MTTTLERLGTYENFKTYRFGTIDKAMERRRTMDETLNESRESFTDQWIANTDRILDMELAPWKDEPDKIQWIDPATGLDCLMVRNHFGAWCGYVGVMFGHPLFGRDYSECTLPRPCESWCDHSGDAILSVHGGITFTSFCDPEEKVTGICHVPAPGRPEQVWWYGFDCGHAWDLMPGMPSLVGGLDSQSTYRDVEYVVEQVELLAGQLKALESIAEV